MALQSLAKLLIHLYILYVLDSVFTKQTCAKPNLWAIVQSETAVDFYISNCSLGYRWISENMLSSNIELK